MVYFGFFVRQMISFSHFTRIILNVIEDEIYGVGLGQKMAPNHNIISGFSLWKTCKDLEK